MMGSEGNGMNEMEAIKDIKENVQPSVGGKSLELAITALEEIQQYRAVGTVEELKKMKERERDNCERERGCDFDKRIS